MVHVQKIFLQFLYVYRQLYMCVDLFLNWFLSSLCQRQSNRIKGIPFRPIKAFPVDLFPHTRHCELVVLFERVDPKILERNVASIQ